MFAVIKTGGKQYRVAANDTITVEKLIGSPGEVVAFEHVLMLSQGETTTVGAPFVDGASVAAEIVEQGRAAKVISFKKRRRQNSKRKRGHRQHLTVVRVTDILTGGAKVAVTAKAPAPQLQAQIEQQPQKAVAKSAGAMDTSNLSLIAGIGPTIEKKLRAAGILNWEQIAAWSADDLAKWDAELALRGRAAREEWVEQARELLAGKPPRAKADQAELKSGKDL